MTSLTKEQRQLLFAATDSAFKKAKSNLVDFRNIVLLNGEKQVPAAIFHYQWSDIILAGESHVAIQGYRESAKSQYILRAFPLYALRFPDPNRSFIVLIKNNADQASSKLREIENEYTTNPGLKINLKEIKEQSASVFSADVYDDFGKVINVRIEAFGKGSSIRGLANADRRPHICVIDDPQDTEDSKSDTVMEKDWDWFLSDVKFLGQNSRVFVIGNNLGDRCIIERIFANSKELGFKTYKIPVMADGKSAWPEKETIEQIEEERESFRRLGKLDVWFREKMCVAVSEESRIFKKEDFRYYGFKTVDELVKGTNIYFTVDPASSTNQESCFRAICVVAVDRDNNWFVLDVPYGRWDSSEFIDTLFVKVKQWRPKQVGIERGMLKQVLDPFIHKEMSKRNVFFDIKDIEHAKQGSKLERVKMLGPRFKAHSIWFPDEGHFMAELESELLGVTRDGFKSLYVDLIDALSMVFQIAEVPYSFQGQDIRNMPREYASVTEI